jgi:hypothetical protein
VARILQPRLQVIGASAWLAYAWGSPAESIWKGKPWTSTFRYLVDGLVYASLTAGAFGPPSMR